MYARRAAVAVGCVFVLLIGVVNAEVEDDHQAHAVPGKPHTVYENPPGSGHALVKMDGSSSHSHYFKEGPPVVSGRIVNFVWINKKTGKVLGRQSKIQYKFAVGETLVEMTVKDQTGDTASATTTVTVVPAERVLPGAMSYYYDVPMTAQYASAFPRPFFSKWRKNVAVLNKNGLPAEFRGITNGAVRFITRFYPQRTGHYKFSITYKGGDVRCWVNEKLVGFGKTDKEGEEKKLVFEHGTVEGRLLYFNILLTRKFFPTRLVLLNSAISTATLPATPLGVTNILRLTFKPRHVIPVALYGSHSRSPIEGGQEFSLRASGLDGAGDIGVTFSCGGISKNLDIRRIDASVHTIYGLIPSFPKACEGSVCVRTQRKGKSNDLPFEFTDDSFILSKGKFRSDMVPLVPVKFIKTMIRTSKGEPFNIPAPSTIAFGPDGRYYIGTLTGVVHILTVDEKSLKVRDSCRSPRVAPSGSIMGAAFNPLDEYGENSATLYMSVSVLYHRTKKTGYGWDNGKIISWKSVNDKRCMIFDREVISGLPVSDRDHGVNSLTFDTTGKLFISVGSITNAGVLSSQFGNLPEGQLSAAVLVADLSRKDFNGKIRYSSKEMGKAKKVSGSVELFATGVRNCYGLAFHSVHGLYATDNGMNQAFGDTSTSCGTSTATKITQADKLLRLTRGGFYGFPNRLRNQCKFEAGKGALTEMESATTGIAEYTANTFSGRLRGQLFLTKFAVRGSGITTRVVLSGDGSKIAAGPIKVGDLSGLAVVVGPRGELVMPQVQQNVIRVLQPQDESGGVMVLSVVPRSGPRRGGNVVAVYGNGFNKGGKVVVTMGGEVCRIVGGTVGIVRCVVPAGISSGGVRVVVQGDGVKGFNFGADYYYG